MEHNPTTYTAPKILQTIFFVIVGFLSGLLILAVLLKIIQNPAILIFGVGVDIALPIILLKKYTTKKDQKIRTISYGILAAGIASAVLFISAYTTITALFQGIAN